MNCGSLLVMAYRPTERTEARKAEVRERILAAARELIARGGYAEARIAVVADSAGVATGTVYRHFPSKAELFAEVFRRASQREVDAMAAAAGDGGRAVGPLPLCPRRRSTRRSRRSASTSGAPPAT